MDHFFILCSKKHSFPDKFDLYLFFKKKKTKQTNKSLTTSQKSERNKKTTKGKTKRASNTLGDKKKKYQFL